VRDGQRAAAALGPALIILIVAAALLVAALTNEGPGREPTLGEIATGLTPAVAEGVEKVRGLKFESVPEPEIVTADDLNELNADELDKPRVRERLRAEEVVAKLLGLVEFDDDLVGVAEESGDLAAAAYDPGTDELYVVEDAVGVSPVLVEFVLAHELNHALEDQRYDISAQPGTGDRELAATALVEGTATVAMIRYAQRFQNVLALSLAAGGVDAGTEGVPSFILDQLLFAYTGGAKFVRALYDQTGSWALVNNALESDPPVSSEQIMHPRKYLLNEGPVDHLFLSVRHGTAGEPEPEPRYGTLGEYATREMLGDAPAAAAAAAGWGVDRWMLTRQSGAPVPCEDEEECRSSYALTVDWYWDTPRDAEEFAGAIPEYLDSLGGISPGVLPGQVVEVDQRGRSVTLSFIPS
jgi:hypothetical protein